MTVLIGEHAGLGLHPIGIKCDRCGAKSKTHLETERDSRWVVVRLLTGGWREVLEGRMLRTICPNCKE